MHLPVPDRSRLITLTAGHLVDDLYQGAVPAMIPFLVAERHYSYTAAAGITLAATFLSSVAQPVFGVLTDRRRVGWLVPAGMATAGMGVGLSGAVDAYAWTWACVALSGLGVAAYHPEATRAARIAAGRSAQGMSVFSLGGNLGFAVAPLVVTPLLIARGVAATPVLALPALLGAGATVVALRRARRPAVESGAAGALRAVDDWRAFGWLTVVVVCRSVAFFGLTSLLALYLERHLGADRAGANTALTVFLAAGAAGTVLGGRLADRLGRLSAVRVGYLLTLPGLAVLLAAPDLAVAYAAAALLGVALYVPFSVHVTLGQDYLPTRIGTASGITLGLAVSVGGVLAPALGALADRFGLVTALATLLVLPVLSLIVSTRLPDSRSDRVGSTVRAR